MSEPQPLVFLLDVDNTLLDNDAVQIDLGGELQRLAGAAARRRYFEIFEELRAQLGYADYLGALQRYRAENVTDMRLLQLADWLLEYRFAGRLYPGALPLIERLRQWGSVVILSDGDAVLQPHKIRRSGLWQAVDGVLIYLHKEQQLADVERLYPAQHYVMIDDKLRVLDAIKRSWGERVTSVIPRQGHYALDASNDSRYAPADLDVAAIGELLQRPRGDFLQAAAAHAGGSSAGGAADLWPEWAAHIQGAHST